MKHKLCHEVGTAKISARLCKRTPCVEVMEFEIRSSNRLMENKGIDFMNVVKEVQKSIK